MKTGAVEEFDNIQLTGIRAFGYIGALPEETVLGQWFEVDITLWLDLALPGASDRLDDTHNYVTLVQQTQQLIETQKFKLIERLAVAIATQALANDLRIHQVKVKVIKLTPPIPHFSGQVAVEIVRKQSSKL